ncbi:MAG: superoxide dismutase [Paludibacter sp.]|nr:superoxide dismutase [Bacteroidales bacterium]MCM1068897.1 superoxide dismutase [Prevotella sp.]MCM1353158.1 superoxide dismutase [Bacteroides sp.]MCM1442480.1 superoxide dismutase [Muribaculum sp.]MCM1481323.1 superoxide dismutase [Paludibacter sp.]
MPVDGKFSLIELPYNPNALEPVISSRTLSFHYGKHLQTYVNNLNAAIEDTPFADKSLEEIVCTSTGGVFNNAGQLLNHNLYFTQFGAPQTDNKPSGRLAAAIDAAFGNFTAFQEEFRKKGTTLFGSGWVWLSADADGGLHITQESNAGNPLCQGLRPLLTFDVWEHAYYLDWQNRRPDHLAALWQIVDWNVVEKRYE